MMGLVLAGAVLAIVAAAVAVRIRQQQTLARAAAALTEAEDGAVWVADGPSDLAGYDHRYLQASAPIRVAGWTLRNGACRYQRFAPGADGQPEVLDEVTYGFVAMHAADLPTGGPWRWQAPAESDLRPAARFVRSIWAHLTIQQEDRVLLRLPERPKNDVLALVWGACRLLAGIRAQVLEEDDLVAWLAAPATPADHSGGAEAAAHAAAWRAEQLLTWFDAHPLARVVAERERGSRYDTLNVRAALVLGDAKVLISSTFNRALPERLCEEALSRGLEIMLASGDFLGVCKDIIDQLPLQRWPELVVPALLATTGPEAQLCVRMAAVHLAGHPQYGPSLLAHALTHDPPDWFLNDMLARGTDGLRAQIVDRVAHDRGDHGAATLCLAALAQQHSIRRSHQAECWLVWAVGERGGAEHRATLQPLTQALTPTAEPDLLLRATATDAIRAITERLPKGLVGGLSVVEGEAGALSAADPQGEDR